MSTQAKRGKKSDWVICHDGTAGDLAYAMQCKRCGEIQRFILPINLTIWLAAGKAFVKVHKGCSEATT